MSTVWLSHPLTPDTPAYGGGEGMRIEPISQIQSGDTANTSMYFLPNHLGTHVDAPRHFFSKGPTLMDFPPDFWIFRAPFLIDVHCDDGSLISIEHLQLPIPSETDMLLLRTGFEVYRGEKRYYQRNPGLDPDFALWIRKHRPAVRALGLDCISVTARKHRKEGRLTHRALLDPQGHGNPVLPIEDMSLIPIVGRLRRVTVAPLRVKDADGGPCTVFGYMNSVKS